MLQAFRMHFVDLEEENISEDIQTKFIEQMIPKIIDYLYSPPMKNTSANIRLRDDEFIFHLY